MTPCPLCRTPIPATDERCPSCGTRVKRAAPVPAGSVPAASTPAPPPPPSPAPATPPPAPATPPPAPAAPPAPPAAAPPPPPAFAAPAPRPPAGAPSAPAPRPPGANAWRSDAGVGYYAAPTTSPGTAALPPLGSQPSPIYAPPPLAGGWGAPPAAPKPRRVRRWLAVVAALVVGGFVLLGVIGVVAGTLDERKASDAISDYVDGDDSVAYDSPDGGYRVEFPTNPVPQDQTIGGGVTEPVVVHSQVSRPGRRYAFEVGYVDLATGLSFPDEAAALAGIVDGMAGAFNGDVTERNTATLQGLPAADFVVRFQDSGDDAYAMGRIALSSSRLYVLTVTAEQIERDAFDRLVESFELTR
jgi:hypothetical protein